MSRLLLLGRNSLILPSAGGSSGGGGDVPTEPTPPAPPASTTPDVVYGDISQIPLQGFGSVSEADLESTFGSIFFSNGLNNLAIAEDSSGRYIRQKYDKTNDGSTSAQFAINLGAHEELYLSYWLYFETGWEWVKGGKLPGMGGGTFPSGGNKPAPGQGFSFRYMWRYQSGIHQRVPRIEGYLYSSDQTQTYGDEIDLGPEAKHPPIGQWIILTQRIKMNTGTNFNAEVQTWLNGVDQGIWTGRLRNGGTYSVDQFRHTSFYGGDNSTWSPSKTTYARFKEYKIATVPSGVDGLAA